MIEIEINTEFIKLDQFLKWASVVESGAAAKHMVNNGIVKLNGEVVFQRGKKLYRGDVVSVEGVGEFVVV